MPYLAYVPSCGTPPQDRQAQRRRAGHFKLHTYGCAGWRHKCLIRPTFLPAGSPCRPGKRSAAGQDTSSSVPAVVPDGGINALSGLRSFLRAPPPRTGKRSAAGRSGSIPAVVTDGGINALSGLRSFPQAHTPRRPGKRSAAGQLVQANSLSSPSGAGPDPAGRGQNSSAPAGSDPDTRPDSA